MFQFCKLTFSTELPGHGFTPGQLNPKHGYSFLISMKASSKTKKQGRKKDRKPFTFLTVSSEQKLGRNVGDPLPSLCRLPSATPAILEYLLPQDRRNLGGRGGGGVRPSPPRVLPGLEAFISLELLLAPLDFQTFLQPFASLLPSSKSTD